MLNLLYRDYMGQEIRKNFGENLNCSEGLDADYCHVVHSLFPDQNFSVELAADLGYVWNWESLCFR